MQQSRKIKQLINEVVEGLDKDLTDDDIFDIVDFQFKTLNDAITNKKFIELPRIGKFMVKEGRDKYLSPEKKYYEPYLRGDNSELNQSEGESRLM